ncbi:O-methyltransferase [Thermonema sp.]|uniref:O-methyltransferase n=1 Tax=Thermonema sp. TaxID=2231181 RepID=UPI0025842B72|nr:O-methyltransferase [Thermonema sp.]
MQKSFHFSKKLKAKQVFTMDFIPKAIQEYAERHSSAEPEVLYDLNRQTHLKVLKPRMLSGHLQGRLLSLISHMIKPQLIVEIGTYTGYSALCLAEGLAENGRLITIDVNEELKGFAESFFQKAGMQDRIQMLIGHAADIIPTLPGSIDLAFIDADKKNYRLYYDLLLPKMRPGGFLLADNVLWSGKVVDASQAKDPATRSIMEFNEYVSCDPRVEKVLLPIRDGIYLIRKK